MRIPTGKTDHWYSLSIAFGCAPSLFDPSGAGIETLPFQTDLAEPEEGLCETTASVGLHEPGEGESFEAHYHFRLFLTRCEAPLADDPRDSHESFLRSLAGGFTDDLTLSITAVGNLALPGDSSWRLDILTDPPDVDADSEGLGNISLAGVTLDFSDSRLGLTRVFMESDFDGSPSQFKIMHRFPMDVSDFQSLIETAITESQSLASLFVEGLTNE